jgi:hypothetical protein
MTANDQLDLAASEAQGGPWHIGIAVDPTKPCNILGVTPW